MQNTILVIGIIIVLVIIGIVLFQRGTIEEYSRVITEEDKARGLKTALKEECLKGNYRWEELDHEFKYRCVHTKETCLKNSAYPSNENELAQYLEWRDPQHKDAKKLQAPYGVCIYGNEVYRDQCESEGLTYNPDTGECKTNYDYCHSKHLAFCNGDCFIDPQTQVTKYILGETVAKAVSYASPWRAITEAACPK